jgi:hypothetical protein
MENPMSEKTIPEKLQVKPGRVLKVIGQPPEVTDRLANLPPYAKFAGENEPADVLLVFIKTMQELGGLLPFSSHLLKPDGIAWLAYPKKTSRVKTDLNRDIIWAYLLTIGWTGVSMISIDETWSGFRLKQK